MKNYLFKYKRERISGFLVLSFLIHDFWVSLTTLGLDNHGHILLPSFSTVDKLVVTLFVYFLFYFIFLSQNSLNPVQLCYMRFEDHHLLFRLKPMIYLTWFASPHEVEPPLVIFDFSDILSLIVFFCISIWEYKPRELKLWTRRLSLKGVHKAHLQQFQPFWIPGLVSAVIHIAIIMFVKAKLHWWWILCFYYD